MVLAQRNGEIAALRDGHRIGQSLGHIGKPRRHLRLRREVLLGCEAAWTPRVSKDVTFGDTDTGVVGAKILRCQKLHGMRGDHGQGKSLSQRHGAGNKRFILRVPCALHFEVVALRKCRRPRPCGARGRSSVALHQCAAYIAVSRPGQRNQALGTLGEPLRLQFGPAAMLIGAIGA